MEMNEVKQFEVLFTTPWFGYGLAGFEDNVILSQEQLDNLTAFCREVIAATPLAPGDFIPEGLR